jgi:hypothetical protein
VTARQRPAHAAHRAAPAGKPDFSAIFFEVNGSRFLVGDFINA